MIIIVIIYYYYYENSDSLTPGSVFKKLKYGSIQPPLKEKPNCEFVRGGETEIHRHLTAGIFSNLTQDVQH